jgi:hypothetical protein
MLVPAAALAALATALSATPAAAVVTVTTERGNPDPGIPSGFTTVVTFDGPSAPGIVNTIFGNVVTSAANISGQRAAPAGTASGGIYQSVGLATPNTSSSTFDFTNYLTGRNVVTGFSLYWGSVDATNFIDFLTADNTVVASFAGNQLPRFDGNQTDAESNPRVTFLMSGMDRVRKVRMRATANAFEYDTLAVRTGPMPEPSSWAMLITGFGLVGAAMRRRAQQAARA